LDDSLVGLFDELVDEMICLVDLRHLHVFLEAGRELLVLLACFRARLFHEAEGLSREHPVVLGGVLESLFDDGVISKELDDAEGQIWSACLLVGLLSLVELVVGTEPVGVRKPDQGLHLGVLLGKHLGLVPLVELHVQAHQGFEVSKPQICLFSKSMVARLSEVLGAQHNFSVMLLFIEVFADVHDGVKILLLSKDFDCLLVLVRLLVQVCSFLPVARVSFELRLLYKDAGVEEWTVTFFSTVFADQIISFIELLEGGQKSNGFVNHVVLDVVSRRFLVLALESKDFALKPEVVKILHFVHLLCQLTEVDELKVSYSAEGFLRYSKVLALECFDSKSSPVLLSDSQTSEFVGHGEVLALEEAEESRGLGHINSVHIVVIEAEDLGAFEADDVSWESLLLSGKVSALDEERVLACVGEHVLNLEVPGN